jgi:hypothetical protein
MSRPKPAFEENVVAEVYPESEYKKIDQCDVLADHDGWFITAMTDPHEGQAFMPLPLAEKVYEAFGRALEAARKRQKELDQ